MYFNIQFFSDKIRDFKNLIRNTKGDLQLENMQTYKTDLLNKFDTFDQMRKHISYLYVKGLINIELFDKAMPMAEDRLTGDTIEKFSVKLMLGIIC